MIRSWMIVFAAVLCFGAGAEDTNVEKVLNSSDSANEEELVKAAEAIGESQGLTKSTEAATAIAANPSLAATNMATTPESQIPVFAKDSKSTIEKSEKTSMFKMIASLVVILVIGAGVTYVARKKAYKRSSPGQGARIEVITQHHFGPKKGLALVRVAGEVMLIGMTDHNISMIKSVSLIDDEVEGLLGKDFNNFLEDDFAISNVQSALRGQV